MRSGYAIKTDRKGQFPISTIIINERERKWSENTTEQISFSGSFVSPTLSAIGDVRSIRCEKMHHRS